MFYTQWIPEFQTISELSASWISRPIQQFMVVNIWDT